MPKNALSKMDSGMVLFVTYIVTFVVSAAVIYLANSFFPNLIVLGTMSIPFWWAVKLPAAEIALVTTFALPFIHMVEERRGKMMNSGEMMGIYFVINFVSVWVVTRFAEIFGMGVASWMVVLGLAVALDFFQGMAMVGLEKWRTQK